MEIFVGRQPIFDLKNRTYAYELLFRSSQENRFEAGATPGDLATQQVISNAFFSLGLDSITGGLPAFINFPRALLVDASAAVLPSQSLVVEILENVEVDGSLLDVCRSLKERRYKLAVDDYVGEPGREELIELADYLKVDFRGTDRDERQRIQRRFARKGLNLLAEKVETMEEFIDAADMGYTLFQGHFFARPKVLSGSEVPSLKANGLRIIRAIYAESLHMPTIAQLVRNDVSLCRRLLRYMNSAAFAWHAPVTTVERALTNLGENGTRRWLSMAVLPELAAGKANALILSALSRAKFCEQVAARLYSNDSASKYFLMGLFSLLDAMLDRPLWEALQDMPLDADAKAALLNQPTSPNVHSLWQLTIACERADAEKAAQLSAGTLRPEICSQMWTNALSWSSTICAEMLPGS